jgi:hypothetical protein
VLVVVGCLVLVVIGLAVAIRLGHVPVRDLGPLPVEGVRRRGEAVARRYAWWVMLWAVTTVVSTVVAVGPGGRLAMRLLAVASPEAAGRLTDAQAVVGEVSVGGTIAFFLFGALPAAAGSTALYLLLHRVLPGGWWRPVSLAGLLLLLFSVRVDPLRPDNIDFAILGPGWLSVATFGLLALLQAAVVVGVTGACSRRIPEYRSGAVGGYTALAVFLALAFPVGAVVVALGLVVVGIGAVLPPRKAIASAAVWTARIAMMVAAALALPGFLSGVRDILS